MVFEGDIDTSKFYISLACLTPECLGTGCLHILEERHSGRANRSGATRMMARGAVCAVLRALHLADRKQQK